MSYYIRSYIRNSDILYLDSANVTTLQAGTVTATGNLEARGNIVASGNITAKNITITDTFNFTANNYTINGNVTANNFMVGGNVVSSDVVVGSRTFNNSVSRATFNVLDYGAKADGVTDDTAAIQAAINAAISSSGRRGGIVFFPTGTYRITSVLMVSLANGVVLRGANSQTTVIRVDSPTPATPVTAAVIIELSQHCHVESLKFECTQILSEMSLASPVVGDNRQTTNAVTSTSGSMIVLRKSCYWCQVYDVRIDYAHNGIEIDGSTETRLTKTQLRYMTGTAGIWLHGSPADAPNNEPERGSYRVVINDFISDNPYKHGTRSNGMKTYSASTAYAQGDVILGQGGRIYQVHTAGTTGTGGVAPYGLGDTVDGTVRWRWISGPISWILQDSYGYSLVVDKAACINGFNGFKMQSVITPAKYPIWAFMYDLECDHCYNAGMDLVGGEGVFVTTSWLGSTLAGNAVNVGSTFRGEVSLTNCRVMGNYYHGVAVQPGPMDVRVEGCFIGQNSQASIGAYDGINCADGVRRIQLVNNRSGTLVGTAGNTQAYGARVGNVTSAILSLNNFENNLTGGLLLGNTSTNTIAWNNLNVSTSINNDLSVASTAANVTVAARPFTTTTDATDLVLAGYGNGSVVTSRSRIGGLNITTDGSDVYMTATPTYVFGATNTDEAAATSTLAIAPASNVTVVSNVTRRGPSSGGSAYFDSALKSYANVPGLSYAFPWNSAPSTLEAWVYFPSVSGTTYILGSYFPLQAAHNVSIGVSGTKAFFRYFSQNPNTDTTLYSPNGSMTAGAWTHIAATATGTSRSTGNISLYINGVRQSLAYANGTSVGETPAKVADASSFAYPFTLGLNNNSAYNSFYLDSARLLLGNAAYTGASFTPPTALSVGPAGANTAVFAVPQVPGTANVFVQLPLIASNLTASSASLVANSIVVGNAMVANTANAGSDVLLTSTPSTFSIKAVNRTPAGVVTRPSVTTSNVDLSTAIVRAPTRTSSLFFDTSRASYANVPSMSYAFPWNSAPSTLEAWVYFPSVSGTTYILGSYFPLQAAHNVSIGVSGTKAFFRYFSQNPNTDTTLYSPNGSMTAGAWTHIAATATGTSRSTGNISLYINGVRQSLAYANGTSVGETPAKVADASSFAYPFTLGLNNNSAYNSFYLDSARLLLGNAAYTGASFTPPTTLGYGPVGTTTTFLVSSAPTDSRLAINSFSSVKAAEGVFLQNDPVLSNVTIVGINTAAPSASLHVVGNVRVEGGDVEALGAITANLVHAATGLARFGARTNTVTRTADFTTMDLYSTTFNQQSNVATTGTLLMIANTINTSQTVRYPVDHFRVGAPFEVSYVNTFNGTGDGVAVHVFGSDDTNFVPYAFSGFNSRTAPGYRFGYTIFGKRVLFGYNNDTPFVNTSAILANNTPYLLNLKFDGAQTWTYSVRDLGAGGNTLVTSGTVTDPAALTNMAAATRANTVYMRASSGAAVAWQWISNVALAAYTPSAAGADAAFTGDAWTVRSTGGANVFSVTTTDMTYKTQIAGQLLTDAASTANGAIVLGNTAGVPYTGAGSAYAGPLVEKRTNAATRFGVGTYNANDTRVYSGTGSTASRVLLGYALSDTSFYDVLTVAREGASTTTGNVGINTSAPAAPLHVVGNVRVDGIVTANGMVITTSSERRLRDYGAKLDGVTDNTSILVSALNTLSSSGGGRLIIDGPVFVSQPSLVPDKSNITLVFIKPGRLVLRFEKVGRIQFLGSSNMTSVPAVTLTGGGGVGATASATLCLQKPNIADPIGSGYVKDQVVALVGGTYTTQATIKVLAVNANGAITNAVPSTIGRYSVIPSNPVTLANGGTVSVTWQLRDITVTSAGSGYTSTPTVSLSVGSCEKVWASGSAITWSGGLAADATDWIFDGPVALTSVKQTYPEWWGVQTANSDNSDTLQNAVDGSQASGCTLNLSAEYKINQPIKITNLGVTGIAASDRNSGLRLMADVVGLWILGSPVLSNFTITCDNTILGSMDKATAYFVDDAYGFIRLTIKSCNAINCWQGVSNNAFETFGAQYSIDTMLISSKNHGLAAYYGGVSDIKRVRCDNVNFAQLQTASHIYIYDYNKGLLGGITLRECGGLVPGGHGIQVINMPGPDLIDCYSDNAGLSSLYVLNSSAIDVIGGFWYLSHNNWPAFYFENTSVIKISASVGANPVEFFPAVVDFKNCTNVLVYSSVLIRAAYGIRLLGCNNVTISDIKMNNVAAGVYADDTSNNVVVRDVDVDGTTGVPPSQIGFATWNVPSWTTPAVGTPTPFSIQCDFKFGELNKANGLFLQCFYSDADTSQHLAFGLPIAKVGAGYRFGYNAYTGTVYFTRDAAAQTTLVSSGLLLPANTWHRLRLQFDGVNTWTVQISETRSDSLLFSHTQTDADALTIMGAATYKSNVRIGGSGGIFYTDIQARNFQLTSGGTALATTTDFQSVNIFTSDSNSLRRVQSTGTIWFCKAGKRLLDDDASIVRNLRIYNCTVTNGSGTPEF